jgi:hypothetical protein
MLAGPHMQEAMRARMENREPTFADLLPLRDTPL